MSLETDIAQHFESKGWTWKLKDGTVTPTDEDVERALDEAARLLYNENVGAQLEVGRLIIVKKHRGHDVYVMAGTYE